MFLALFVTMRYENGYGHAWALAFSPDGQQLMVAYNNETVRIWDLSREQAGPLRFKLGSDTTHAVLPSSPQFGGPRLLGALRISRSKETPDGYELWDTAASRRVRVVPLPYRAEVFQVSEKGRVVLASSRDAPRTLDLFDMESGRHIGSLEGSESVPGRFRIHGIMSADGEWVAASFDERDDRAMLKVWSVETRQCAKSLWIESGYGLEISHDGKFLVDNGRDIWDLEKGEKVLSIDRGRYAHSESDFSADGRMLALTSYYNGMARVWDAAEGRLLAELLAATSPMDASRRTHVAFSPDEKYLATSTGRTVRLWDATDFQRKRSLASGRRLLAAAVCSFAFILWSIVWGVLWRRLEPQRTESQPRRSWLVLPMSILLGFAGVIAVFNSTFGVLHPGLWSCCTPTLLLMGAGYLGLGTGILVLTRAIGHKLQGVAPATLMLMLFNSFSDFSLPPLTVLVSGGMALLLGSIIAARKPNPPTDGCG